MSINRFASLGALRHALASREIGAVELAQHYLQALHADSLGAALALNDEETLAQARAAQARLDAGEHAPLLGLPIIHKDVFVTRSWPTTAGSRMLEGYRSPFDAEVVCRLEQAGMVSLGKANCDEFAMGSTNQHSAFGPCRNPWSSDRVPGGSSGGSAAAVAAGLSPAATGTDTGGSVRQPAALCGITGLKPTYGRVSRWGMVAYASSLDQAGVMARSAQDCATLLSAIAGFDEKDATSLEMPAEDFSRLFDEPVEGASARQPLLGLRLGLPRQYLGPGLSEPVRLAVEAALQEFERLGASLVEIDLPLTELSVPAYYVIAPAEASSNLSRFDGVRYGHRADHPTDLHDLYCRSRSEGFGPEVRRRILVGSFVLSHGYYDAYYLQAQRVRRLIARDFEEAFSRCDLIAGPVSPTLAGPIHPSGETDPLAEYLSDVYTLGASLAGLPGLSMPCGFGVQDSVRLPVGLQLIGPKFLEARLLAVAHAFQRVTDWHEQLPPGGH